MRILFLGAGGTGGFFGGRLAQAGADVTFLVRPKRAAKLTKDGLLIRSPSREDRFPVKTVTADTLAGDWDLVVLSCKAYDLADAIASIRPAVRASTMVLPLLNGLAHYRDLDAAFGAEKVLGGLCHIFAMLGPDGEVIQMTPLARLTFGERQGGSSPRTEAITTRFSDAGFDSRHSLAVMQDAWEKYAFLAALAAMTCLMRATVGQIAATAEGEAIAREMYAETAGIAGAARHAPRDDVNRAVLAMLTDPKSTQTASMLRDLEAGGRTEGEHIIGDMVEHARALGLQTPLLRVALCHLQAYEIRRTAGG